MASAGGDADGLLGQERALDAVRLAIGIDAPGYNVFVTGLRTRQERGTVLRLLEEQAARMPTPGDWVYVNNFRSPEAPVALYLKPGQGNQLRTRMQELVNYVLDQLPKAFRREDFDHERAALREKYNRRGQELFGNFETRAASAALPCRALPVARSSSSPSSAARCRSRPRNCSAKCKPCLKRSVIVWPGCRANSRATSPVS